MFLEASVPSTGRSSKGKNDAKAWIHKWKVGQVLSLFLFYAETTSFDTSKYKANERVQMNTVEIIVDMSQDVRYYYY